MKYLTIKENVETKSHKSTPSALSVNRGKMSHDRTTWTANQAAYLLGIYSNRKENSSTFKLEL